MRNENEMVKIEGDWNECVGHNTAMMNSVNGKDNTMR